MKTIGGTAAAVIMKGEEGHFGKTPFMLYEEFLGLREEEDLSDVLRVQMGIATESFNGDWYTKQTGNVLVRDLEPLRHPNYDFMHASVDGLVPKINAVFEAKHTGAWSKSDAVQNYYPQLQHYMMVTGRSLAHLSVFKDNSQWNLYEVPIDEPYIEEMARREIGFWEAVQDKTPPEEGMPLVNAPKAAPIKTVDMFGNNEWAASAADWMVNKKAAKVFDTAAKSIKGLTPDDAAIAHGHGVLVTRDKKGSLRIKEQGDE
jgi:predicted phage-related endonuclease